MYIIFKIIVYMRYRRFVFCVLEFLIFYMIRICVHSLLLDKLFYIIWERYQASLLMCLFVPDTINRRGTWCLCSTSKTGHILSWCAVKHKQTLFTIKLLYLCTWFTLSFVFVYVTIYNIYMYVFYKFYYMNKISIFVYMIYFRICICLYYLLYRFYHESSCK
jgi:hypothetical protein